MTFTRVASPRSAGSHVGPFVLARFLGGGADTEVWRAEGDGVIVALKLVRDRSDPIATARLAREALALRLLEHPHVIRCLDADDSDGEPWIAAPLHDAGTLAQRLDRGRLSATEAAAALAPIAEALAAAHACGIVHRDVNPANVLLSASDGPILIDFGHAAVAGHRFDGWTATGAPAVARTEGYAAPESETSPASDVFALGVSLLEAVTGVRSLAAVDAPAPSTAIAGLRDLIARCCAQEPSRRPDAAAVALELQAFAGDVPPPHEPAPLVVDLVRAEAFEATAARGRSLELDELASSLRGAIEADELRCVLVVAGPGCGKSWLLETALARAHDAGIATRLTRCSETIGDLRVLRTVVESILADPRLGAATARTLRRAVGIGGVGDLHDAREVADALADALRLRPVAIVIDDLHHASAELLAVIRAVAFRTGVPGVFWLGARPGYVDVDELGAAALALGPLDDAALRAAVLDVTDEDHAGAAVAVAGGNPLHAREAARALAAGIALDDDLDLRGVIAARIDAADRVTRDALVLAAAAGDPFWPEAIGGELLDGAAALLQHGYARARVRSQVEESTELAWTHPLLREVAYESLTELDRRVLHGRLARRFETRRDIGAELLAHHCARAFRLGDQAIASSTARAAAAAAREALDHYAIARAAEWVELLRETDRETLRGTADVLDAEVKNRQGDFTNALHLLLPHADRLDEAGTRALVVGTESLVGIGDYERAVAFGTAARERLLDRPLERALNARGLAVALRERGELDAALEELDTAADLARSDGDDVLATRLASEAVTVATLLNQNSPGALDWILRARSVLEELLRNDDPRGLLEMAASAAADAIAIEDPTTALELQQSAFDATDRLGDGVARARAARRLIEVAWDAERPDVVSSMLPHLDSPSVGEEERLVIALIADVAYASVRDPDPELADRLIRNVTRLDRVSQFAKLDQHMALCALAYEGRMGDLAHFAESFDQRRRIPLLFRIFAGLHGRILAGPPFLHPEELVPSDTTAFHNELAMLAYLRGDFSVGDELMRDRRQFLLSTGNTHQGYTVTFAGALFSALGPPDCEPRTEWVRSHIYDSVFPGIWTFQRTLVAVLLAERGESDRERLLEAAARLRSSISPDPAVAAWFDPRLEALTR